jgi:hypothetical protein
LDVLGISTFDLEKQGDNYIVRPTCGTTKKSFLEKLAELLKGSQKADKQASETLCYTPSDISRVAGDQQWQHRKTNVMPDAHKLAQLLPGRRVQFRSQRSLRIYYFHVQRFADRLV